MENTLGEKRVKVDFNITDDKLVHSIKIKTAELINNCGSMRDGLHGTVSQEKHRLLSLAQTAYEEACMWAVKANFTE